MSEDLHQTLDELHRQLERAGPIDAKARAHLQAALDEVNKVLAQTDPGSASARASHPETAGLIDRLRTWVERIEQEHPTLSASLADLLDTLRKV